MNIHFVRFLLPLALLSLALLSLALSASARERILDYHADIVVQADGTLDVTEIIEVHAEGKKIRRGIYRDFPTRYKNRYGDRVVVDFEVVGVERDGESEPWFTEDLSNGVRINTGNDRFLPTPLTTTYRIRYRTGRQLGFFDEHDELYWNVTGTGWVFDIESASARVQLPEPVPAEQLQLDYYTGPQGSHARNATAEVVEPGVVRFSTTQPLFQHEGLTIVVGFPKGIVAEPSSIQKLVWYLSDNRAQLLLLLGLMALFGYYLHHWRRDGRDPRAGVTFARYHAPEDFSPGGLRYLSRGSYDDRCFAADVVHMSVKGLIAIYRDKKLLSDKWRLEKRREAKEGELTPSEKAMFSALFVGGDDIELDQKNHVYLGLARKRHKAALSKRFKPTYFVDNIGITLRGCLASAVLAVLALWWSHNILSLSLWVLVISFVVLNAVFGLLMRRPTMEGRRLLDHIEGLKLYMEVASKEDIARLKHRHSEQPPSMNAERFETLLPYALALDVEEAWTGQFTQAVGVNEANRTTRNMGWYHGSLGRGGLAGLSSDLGKSMSSQIASSSSAPGTSSGGGGGGFSGGGGGGGGGGGR